MERDALEPKLEQAQKALEIALDEACDVDVRRVNTDELVKIDEALAVASKAAKEAVSVRLRMRSQRARAGASKQRDASPAPDAPVHTQRVFDDVRGKRWRVFAVHPSAATVERAALPEPFLKGWLSFDSADEVRRVAPIPEQWQELSIDELRLLCKSAEVAPKLPGLD